MKSISALLCTLALFFAAGSYAQTNQDRLTIQLDADSTEADAAKGVIRFSGVTIEQGELSVRARHAESSSLDFADSTWTFSGAVRFASADTRIQADRAVLTFQGQQLKTASLSGAPLEFVQTRDGDVRLTSQEARLTFRNSALATAVFSGSPVNYRQTAAGSTTSSRAETLNYDAAAGTIKLLGNAWIGDAGKEIQGNSITYNFKTRSYVAASDTSGNQRVTITITPQESSENKPK